ncbi:MAG: hypothetical protein VXZ83_04250, partial [Verrucomicrobiota bacterium]|nr:hypothetical protein [Verrucomicrobiota bacterium]
IEVVIALAVFGLASTVLMSSFVDALLSRDGTSDKSLIENDIRAVRMQLLLEPNIKAAEDGNEYDSLSSGEATWKATINPTSVVDLFMVDFSVKFSDPPEGQSESYSETLYLLRPTWSERDERDELLQDKRKELLESRRDYRF